MKCMILVFFFTALVIAADFQPWQMKRKLDKTLGKIQDQIYNIGNECRDHDVRSVKKYLKQANKALKSLKAVEKTCKKNANKMDNPCKDFVALGIRKNWNTTTGNIYINTTILANQTKRECNPAKTWFKIRDLSGLPYNMTDPMKEGDWGNEENMIQLCPGRPGCEAYMTRYYTADNYPYNVGERRNVTFTVMYVGECLDQAGRNISIEMLRCSDEGDDYVYRLPRDSCIGGELCRNRWENATRPVNMTTAL